MSGGQPMTVAMHEAPIKEIAWVPEMNLLVTGSWDKTLRCAWISFTPSLFNFYCHANSRLLLSYHINFVSSIIF